MSFGKGLNQSKARALTDDNTDLAQIMKPTGQIKVNIVKKRENRGKLRAVTDHNIDLPQIMKTAGQRQENIVGKGKNPGNQHFLLFPQCLQKHSFSRVVKF